MDATPAIDFCDLARPWGVTIAGRTVLVAENKGDPLGLFPSLQLDGRPYNLWLAEHVLDPVLARWGADGGDGCDRAGAIARDIEWACGRSRRAFQEILPEAARRGDPAILAAMGVTANLQRTLAVLGEFVLDDPPVLGPRTPLHLSRLLGGLVDYPAGSPYFPGKVQPPVHAGRLRSRRTDLRYLGNALWCSRQEINRCCEEALAVLGDAARRHGSFREFR